MSPPADPRHARRAALARERRDALLEAALDEFLAKGFADTRIEDVARRAGVAKGTVYLYFKDKEDLFAAAIRAEMTPVAAAMAALIEDGEADPRQAMEALLTAMLKRLRETRTGDVIRLIMAETIRFPQLTRFYRDEVVVPMLRRLSALLQRAKAAGELRVDSTAQFPQLIIAPLMLTALARGFDLEAVSGPPEELLQAHLANVFR